MPKKADYTLNVVVIGPVVTSADELDRAFNEWMRRYTEDPEKFLRDWQQVENFKQDESHGKAPSYGRDCTNYLLGLLKSPTKRLSVKGVKAAQANKRRARKR